jgi:hypothetical protein|tara:strand:+ start:1302 stop:1565 length:264 start_codon:yes stop_codon:yes gene_type:complete
MRNYIYKVLIFTISIIVIFEFTLGKHLNKLEKNISFFTTKDGRKQIISSIKKEMRKANDKENYLDEEERILLRNFIKKVKKELELNN